MKTSFLGLECFYFTKVHYDTFYHIIQFRGTNYSIEYINTLIDYHFKNIKPAEDDEMCLFIHAEISNRDIECMELALSTHWKYKRYRT